MPERNEYRRPPKHTQFQKGTSGNPGGRPKGTLNLSTVLQRALDEPVVIVKAGKEKRVSKMEAAVRRLVDKAITGDMSAFRLLSDLARMLDDSGTRLTTEDLAIADQKLLQSLAARFGS
ncbi:MAG TPA: DUF5681 domain-containing protein [Terriglobales bacterium]|nr:DUF5681 domain-containing protein [Terriglobales bacterium]